MRYSDRRLQQLTVSMAEAEKALWQDNLRNLRKAKRNANMYAKIMEELLKLGMTKTLKETKMKIQNLGNKYKQTSTPPNLARSRPPLHTDTGSPSSGVPRTDTSRQQNSVAGGQPQNPVAPGPSRGPPRGQQGVVERQPLQPPTEFRVPQPPPLQPQFISPLTLFQYSFGTLNDYCGTLISKMRMRCHHQYPFFRRDAYNTASILDVYTKAERVLDYLTNVEKQLGAPRKKMVDIAATLSEAMSELVQTLRHEEIPKEQTWNVQLHEMVDFLVDPENRIQVTSLKVLIAKLHNGLGRIAYHAMTQVRH